jgi:NAD(P)-dependent dehydrogenase (short-subunit alcohol dehydrogenase family)
MKVAVITGGSRSLGKSMSLPFAEKGHDILLTCKSKKAEADAVVAEIANLGRKAAAFALNVRTWRS